ncbi:uncharacterized protein ZBIST_3401 [Zygosaccharomyces bailii]|nr:uncharacterized protein ZBIST_3401 [Zygosaccharomyces bailii]
MHQHQRPSAAAPPPPLSAAAAAAAVNGQVAGLGAGAVAPGGVGSGAAPPQPAPSGPAPGTSQGSQLSSVYRLLHTPPDSAAAQLQLWRYQLPSPQFTQSAYSYHDSAQKAAVDRAGRFAPGPAPWRNNNNAMSPPDSAGGNNAGSAALPLANHRPASGGPNAAGANAGANSGHAVLLGDNNKRNTQEAVARGIAERHKHRPIAEYAAVVRQAELAVLNMDPQTHSKTLVQTAEQNRERERQVYALLWLMKSCGAQQDSYVPRGRIFAQYAASCAQNGLKPLSQASLGKLIRAVFPDLTTRRLGMRGQSRYHYCGLKLIGNASTTEQQQPNSVPSIAPSGHAVAALSPRDQMNRQLQLGQLPMPQQLVAAHGSAAGVTAAGVLSGAGSECPGGLPKPEPHTPHRDSDHELVFSEDLYERVFSNEKPIPNDYTLKFPRIPRECLPPGSDEDIISSLESLYHVHCNTIFEHVRFMKFDQLSHSLVLFGSGSISPQMYNLFTNKGLHEWVHECDHVTHAAMIKCLSRMLSDFQGVSANAIQRLEEFAKSYSEQVAESIIDLPVAMVAQKTETVATFSRLVRKLVQLIKYLRETSKILPNFPHMSKDWLSYDNLDDVLYVINRNGYEKVVPVIRHFMSVDVTKFVDELAAGRVRLDLFVSMYITTVAHIKDVAAYKIVECLMVFSKVFTADISIKMQQNGYPWYVLDMLSNLLIGYCYELCRFI